MISLIPEEISKLEAFLDTLRPKRQTEVSDYGWVHLESGLFSHYKTVCHASLKSTARFFGPNEYADIEGEVLEEELCPKTIFFTRNKTNDGWMKFLLSPESPYRPFLDAHVLDDTDFMLKKNTYVFPFFYDACPVHALFSFCVATRQPWDVQEQGAIGEFIKRFNHFCETYPPRLSAFLALGYRGVNGTHYREHPGQGHGVLCELSPEAFYPRWINADPKLPAEYYKTHRDFPDSSSKKVWTDSTLKTDWWGENVGKGAFPNWTRQNRTAAEIVERLETYFPTGVKP
jgi:hypothetical protein